MTTLLFDYDPILYTAGSVGETRSIKAVHIVSGDDYEFTNRTAFYGHWKAKSGGWLAEYNSAKTIKRVAEEFDIVDVQEPEPIANCLHTMKQIITGIKEAVGADRYYGYSGKGKVFREDVSTVLKYKGNRDGSLRPLHLDELKAYLVRHHDCQIIEKIEADDACSIDCYTAWEKWRKTKADKDKLVLAFIDKDYLQCSGHLYNTNTANGIDSYSGLGYLTLNNKGDVKGRGRMWLYHQCLSSDKADNYAANSASDMKWGDKSSYSLLKDCTNDKQAFEALVKGYKTLYPQAKKITGWRGDEIEIDWQYMLQENLTLAFMLRKQGDSISVKDTLTKLGVDTE